MAETYPPEIPILSDEEFEKKIWPRKLLMSSKGTPELTTRRTGKVIIVNGKGDWEILEGVKYSNLDHHWYDGEGNPHPLYEKYCGKKFGLQFTITAQDKEGKEHIYSNIFLSPMPHGEMGQIHWDQVWKAEKLEAEFAIKTGYLSGYDDPHFQHFLRGAASSLAIFTTPQVLHRPDVQPLHVLLSLLFCIDEQFDPNVFASMYKVPYSKIDQVKVRLLEVAKGLLDPEECEVDFEYLMLKPLCRSMKYLRTELRKRFFTDEMYDGFVDSVAVYLNAVVLKSSQEWNEYRVKFKTGTAVRSHWELRSMDTGNIQCTLCQLMVCNIELPQKITDSHLWKYVLKLCQDGVRFCNDVFSYRKEVNDGESCNSVIVRHFEENMDLVEAMDVCVTDANKCVLDMIELGDVMLKTHNEDDALKNAIYLMKASGLGQLNWYNYAPRYHAGIVFNQVIYLDDDVMLEQLKLKVEK